MLSVVTFPKWLTSIKSWRILKKPNREFITLHHLQLFTGFLLYFNEFSFTSVKGTCKVLKYLDVATQNKPYRNKSRISEMVQKQTN